MNRLARLAGSVENDPFRHSNCELMLRFIQRFVLPRAGGYIAPQQNGSLSAVVRHTSCFQFPDVSR